jgi:hypothetical protein
MQVERDHSIFQVVQYGTKTRVLVQGADILAGSVARYQNESAMSPRGLAGKRSRLTILSSSWTSFSIQGFRQRLEHDVFGSCTRPFVHKYLMFEFFSLILITYFIQNIFEV